MVEWLAHVFLICDIPELILGPETLYILTEVVWFSSVLPGKCRDRYLRPFPSASFPVYHSLIIRSYDAICVQSDMLTASLNEPLVVTNKRIR